MFRERKTDDRRTTTGPRPSRTGEQLELDAAAAEGNLAARDRAVQLALEGNRESRFGPNSCPPAACDPPDTQKECNVLFSRVFIVVSESGTLPLGEEVKPLMVENGPKTNGNNDVGQIRAKTPRWNNVRRFGSRDSHPTWWLCYSHKSIETSLK